MPYETKHYNMKTMNDFKGTKGELEISGNKIQVNPDDPMTTSTVAMMFGSMALPESQANAKLFANSKKALEALIKLRQEYEFSLRNQAGLWGNDTEQIRKWISENPVLKETDNVINESL